MLRKSLILIVHVAFQVIYSNSQVLHNGIIFPSKEHVSPKSKVYPPISSEDEGDSSASDILHVLFNNYVNMIARDYPHKDTNSLFDTPKDIHKTRHLIRKSEPQEKTFYQKTKPKCFQENTENMLCEEDLEYDKEISNLFKKALKKIQLDKPAIKNIISKIVLDVVEDPISVSTRLGDKNQFEDPVCPSINKMIFPKRAKTRSEEYVFILNDKSMMEQGVKVEQCINSPSNSFARSSSGNQGCKVFEEDQKKTICTQKFIYRNMLALHKSGSEIITESVLMPSCCVCRRVVNHGNRIGPIDEKFSGAIQPRIHQIRKKTDYQTDEELFNNNYFSFLMSKLRPRNEEFLDIPQYF